MPRNPERYLSHICIEHPTSDVYLFQLTDQGTGVLRVEYERPQKAWQITDIQSGSEGQGIGQALILRMKQTLGPQQKIICDIEEPETLQQIHTSGLDLQATQRPFTLTDRSTLQSLKLVHVLEGGGLQTDCCILEWIPLTKLGYSSGDIAFMRAQEDARVKNDKYFFMHWQGST